MRKSTLIILTMLLVFSVTSYAEIPHQMTYQGKLVDRDGNPIDQQTVSVTFRIYDSFSKPIEQALWSEVRSITPKKGVFNIVLGEVTPINNIDFNAQYYLGLQVGTDPEMAPRLKLASAAYAFNAERLNGKSVTEFSLANHTHDASNITTGILPVSRGGSGIDTSIAKTGTYTGNGGSKSVSHGLGAAPSFIMICDDGTGIIVGIWIQGMPKVFRTDGNSNTDNISVDAANFSFTTGNAFNRNGRGYNFYTARTN